MLAFHKETLPSLGLRAKDGLPVCKYTVLVINERVGDCAAYAAVGKPLSANEAENDALIERVKGYGTKISESEARELFDEIEDMGLRYRR